MPGTANNSTAGLARDAVRARSHPAWPWARTPAPGLARPTSEHTAFAMGLTTTGANCTRATSASTPWPSAAQMKVSGGRSAGSRNIATTPTAPPTPRTQRPTLIGLADCVAPDSASTGSTRLTLRAGRLAPTTVTRVVSTTPATMVSGWKNTVNPSGRS